MWGGVACPWSHGEDGGEQAGLKSVQIVCLRTKQVPFSLRNCDPSTWEWGHRSTVPPSLQPTKLTKITDFPNVLAQVTFFFYVESEN